MLRSEKLLRGLIVAGVVLLVTVGVYVGRELFREMVAWFSSRPVPVTTGNVSCLDDGKSASVCTVKREDS